MQLQINGSDSIFRCDNPRDMRINFLVRRRDGTEYTAKINFEDWREEYWTDQLKFGLFDCLSQLDWSRWTPEIHPKVSYSYTIQECDISL